MMGRYDKSEYYDRIPQKRRDSHSDAPSAWAVLMVAVIVMGILALIAWAALTDGRMGEDRVPDAVTAEQPMDTVGGTSVYVLTDPDTSRQYLVTDGGGICQREGSADAFVERGL